MAKATLTAKQKQSIKADLLRQFDKLARRAGGAVATEIDFTDPTSLEQIEEYKLLGHLAARDEHRLQQIARALFRLENGTYGNCAGCAKPIPAERLEVVPETENCRLCA